MAALKNACVRYRRWEEDDEDDEDGDEDADGELVAWAFLGVDGSLTSLHTEAAHRGKGLARAVVRGLLSMDQGIGNHERIERAAYGEGYMGGWAGWATSDVYWDNRGGHGVAKGLGGREGWVNRWVGCDLGRCREVWRRQSEGEA